MNEYISEELIHYWIGYAILFFVMAGRLNYADDNNNVVSSFPQSKLKVEAIR